jgi:transcriptional regulator with XRE-family HTH domain
MTWGERLQAWMERNHMRNKDMSIRTGKKPQYISELTKRDTAPTEETMNTVLNAFGVTKEEFYSYPETHNKFKPSPLSNAEKIERIIDIAFRLNGDALSRLYSYAVYLESQERSKKNISKIS